jgi:hypothetical protein
MPQSPGPGRRPGAEVGALYQFLWSIAYRGSLSEAFGAINHAIEGVTGEWSRLVLTPREDERERVNRSSAAHSNCSAAPSTAPPSPDPEYGTSAGSGELPVDGLSALLLQQPAGPAERA